MDLCSHSRMCKILEEEMMEAITRSLLASVLLLLIMLGWLGDSLLSALIGRPKLSFQEVYRSWKHHLLHQ